MDEAQTASGTLRLADVQRLPDWCDVADDAPGLVEPQIAVKLW